MRLGEIINHTDPPKVLVVLQQQSEILIMIHPNVLLMRLTIVQVFLRALKLYLYDYIKYTKRHMYICMYL